MVHKMDAMSKNWRDDPVRSALEKKQNRAAAADRLVQANAMASELLQKRLKDAEVGASSSSRWAGAEDEDPTRMNDADYRHLLEQQRKRLLDDDEDSSSSNISVFDPFMSKKARREEKSERKGKEHKREKKEKREKHKKKKEKKEKKEKHKKHKESTKRKRESDSCSDSDS